jgi:hypothetical protein
MFRAPILFLPIHATVGFPAASAGFVWSFAARRADRQRTAALPAPWGSVPRGKAFPGYEILGGAGAAIDDHRDRLYLPARSFDKKETRIL